MKKALLSAAAAMAAVLVFAPAASAVDDVNSSKLRKGLTTGGTLEHMRTLQRLANANDGNRAASTPGYLASLDYVERRLKRAGYKPKRVPFEFARWEQNGPALLQREGSPAYAEGDPAVGGGDYIVAQFAGSGNVTAPIVTTGTAQLPPPGGPGSGTDGCEATDWTGKDLTGKIALIQRGTCTFTDKIALAESLGAAAVLVFNDGSNPDREEPLAIGANPFTAIPAAMVSNNIGEALYTAGAVNVTFNLSTTTTEVTEYNLTADTKSGDEERTIVVGGHLDSVEEGPGINDNGSGTSSILEMAEEIAQLKQKPRNRIRFAFWGAEESGLIGSTEYVQQLIDSGDIDDIEANLNFDMLGSPNFVRFVYDGDNSTGEGAVGPPGSAEIEQVFLDYFDAVGLPIEPTAFDGRSDYGPFIAPAAFVPAGGLFSGAEGVKTAEQAAIYGGAAGSWYDPCYHQACDTFSTQVGMPPLDAPGLEAGSQAADAALMDGNGPKGLGQLADAAAHATWTLARSKSPLVGPADARKAKTAKSKRKFRAKANRAAKKRQFKGGQRIR